MCHMTCEEKSFKNMYFKIRDLFTISLSHRKVWKSVQDTLRTINSFLTVLCIMKEHCYWVKLFYLVPQE